MRRRRLVDEPQHRFHSRDARADENGGDHEQTGDSFGPLGTQEKSNSQRHGRQRVTEVVDQVGKQRHLAREREDQHLGDRGDGKDGQRNHDRPNAVARALDRLVD